jgi:hypothetical protein
MILASKELLHEANAPAAVRWNGHMADDVGASYGPDPMAFLSATPDEIILCGTRGQFRLPRAAIRKIGRGKMYPWCFSAVRLHHTLSSVPSELQFKPLGASWRDVLTRLEALGYPRG